MIILRICIRLLFKINNEVIDPFFVTTKCMLPVKELAVKILSPLLPLLMREHLCYLIQEL